PEKRFTAVEADRKSAEGKKLNFSSELVARVKKKNLSVAFDDCTRDNTVVVECSRSANIEHRRVRYPQDSRWLIRANVYISDATHATVIAEANENADLSRTGPKERCWLQRRMSGPIGRSVRTVD